MGVGMSGGSVCACVWKAVWRDRECEVVGGQVCGCGSSGRVCVGVREWWWWSVYVFGRKYEGRRSARWWRVGCVCVWE